MTGKQIMAASRGDAEYRAALLAVRNARPGQKERKKRELVRLVAERLKERTSDAAQ
ncbi:hypothetical protein [Reyranella sp.]|uniref:hypothetical protein n=1 Tax=Reyranella sp. TaxID=1929291 RepID=UPI0040374308